MMTDLELEYDVCMNEDIGLGATVWSANIKGMPTKMFVVLDADGNRFVRSNYMDALAVYSGVLDGSLAALAASAPFANLLEDDACAS